MSTHLQRLAQWAVEVTPADLPADVLERARMQHLALAGAAAAGVALPSGQAAIKASSARGGARLLPSNRRGTRRDAVRFHVGAVAQLSLEDGLLGGWTGAGAAASWGWARGATLDDLLAATVVANELGGRLGCALLLSEDPAALQAVIALSAAAAAARLQGLDASRTAHAFALALQSPRTMPDRVAFGAGDSRGRVAAASAADGLLAVDAARAGLEGPLDLLDDRGGLLTLSPLPLRAAFTGLGQTWLSRTLCFKRHPGHALLQVPVQAVAEVLTRHIKAADKRLRKDQVQSVQIKVTAPTLALEARAAGWPGLHPAGLTRSVSRSIGALLTAHEFGPAQLDAGWLEANRDSVARIASGVTLSHDWALTLGQLEHLLTAASPLFTGVTAPELRDWMRGLTRRWGVALGAPGGRQALEALKLLPGRIQSRLRRESGDLSTLDEDAWRFKNGIDMRLFTIRGGWWPERRELPEGSPGWPWEDTRAIVRERSGLTEDAFQAAMALPGSTDGEAWLATLA